MQKDKLNLILQELYVWNPRLKTKETELIELIELMVKAKPDTNFDMAFAESLKKDLLSHRILLDSDEGLKDDNLLINFKNMNKKIYIITGSLALMAVVIFAVMINKVPKNSLSFINSSKEQFVAAGPGAFGNLALLSPTNSAAPQETAAGSKTNSAVAPTTQDSVASVGKMASPVLGLGGGGGTISSRLMMPVRSYDYVYKGDPLELTEATSTVYRRIKGDGNLSSNLDSLINTKTFGPINLSAFSNLQTGSISLMENKKLGLNINIDFREETIYIGQNWLQWQSARDNCGDNQACWDSYRIKIGSIPEDSIVIQKTNDFLAEKGINLDHYGAAKVDNNWRVNYEASTDKANYYIPEEVSVIYPLVVDGKTVYDQNGNLDGLRVNYNLLQNAVSGVNNLTSYRFETSDYNLETDSAKILGLAQKGGYGSGIFYSQTQDKVTLELGTPTKSLIHFWRYTNNVNEELLIPALIFPVNNPPADYFGSKFITVPLPQEMVTELINNNSNGSSGGGITPMMR